MVLNSLKRSATTFGTIVGLRRKVTVDEHLLHFLGTKIKERTTLIQVRPLRPLKYVHSKGCIVKPIDTGLNIHI